MSKNEKKNSDQTGALKKKQIRVKTILHIFISGIIVSV